MDNMHYFWVQCILFILDIMVPISVKKNNKVA